MPIKASGNASGIKQLTAAFKKNWKHYLQEGLGLGVFMASACFFSAMFFSEMSSWHQAIPSLVVRNVLMGIAMGLTALFIFYSPITAPSGSQINPAVTITFLRLGKMCVYDAMFFIAFQILGGCASVYLMQLLMGDKLTGPPVNSAVTVPGPAGLWCALITEIIIAFITMSVVLFSSGDNRLKKFTRLMAAALVCIWVIVAGPVSGFGMNPARSFASALPANTWTSFWVYLFSPFIGMLLAAEFHLTIEKWRVKKSSPRRQKVIFKRIV